MWDAVLTIGAIIVVMWWGISLYNKVNDTNNKIDQLVDKFDEKFLD
jgi:hypothetical protein